MSATDAAERLRAELADLGEVRERLAAALAHAAGDLDSAGAPPPAELSADLAAYRRRLREVAAQLGEDRAGPPLPGRADGRIALDDLLDACAERVRAQHTRELLETVLALHHADDPDYAPLQPCHADARRLSDALNGVGDWPEADLAQLSGGWHPLAALVRLVQNGASLADVEWSQLQDAVAAAYGRHLSTAVARGRIVAQRPAAPPAASPPSAPRGNSSIFTAVPRRESFTGEMTSLFEAGSSILPGVGRTGAAAPADAEDLHAPAPEPVPAAAAAAPAAATSLDSDSILEIVPPTPVRHDTPTAHLARVTAGSSGILRTEHQAELAWLLIQQDRLPLAAQLAACLEARPSASAALVPSALLRTLALGRELCYAKGELARELDAELRSLRPAELIPGGVAAGTGLGFLIRAACLQPALFGASSSAAALLRSIRIEPGLSQLYNYCTRVAAFGERLQGQAADLFQAPAEQLEWVRERQQLRQEVQQWLAESLQRAAAYARTSPLFVRAHWTLQTRTAQRSPDAVHRWAKWQEVLLLAHRLLRPVRDDQDGERNFVKQEASRISAQLRLEPLDDTLARPGGSRGIAVPLEEMRTLLLEAVDLANRWLRLCAAAPTRNPALAPEAAEELRVELLDRTDAVLAELDAAAQADASPATAAGVQSCRRAVERVRDLCSGQAKLGLHEPEPRTVLRAELLRIPHLELNEHWQPQNPPAEIERLVLEHLSAGVEDWRAAFHLQCSVGDHVATERLLELPVWSSPKLLQQLRRSRLVHLDWCRKSAEAEIDEFLAQLTPHADARPDLAEPRVELERRLAGLRNALPRTLSFDQVRSQLDQLRASWQRALQGDVLRVERQWGAAPAEARPLGDDDSVASDAAAPPPPADPLTASWVFNEG